MHRHLERQLFLFLLFAGVLVVFCDSPLVYAQFLGGCNVVNIAPTGPPLVGEGQTLQVTTAVTGSCDQSMFYAVRVDLADGRSSQVLSSVVFPYIPVTAVFTVNIVNKATAPTSLGTWVLQVNAYLIASINGGIVASAHQLFSVVVVQYTPTTTTTSEQMTTNSTTTIILMPVNSTSQMISTSETSYTTSSLSAVAENTNQTSTLIGVAAILAVLAAIVIVMLSKRKRTTQKPQPQQSTTMKYCGQCGIKLAADDEFCIHCGTKQS